MEEEIDKGMKESVSAASEDDIFRVKVGYTHPHSLSKERERERDNWCQLEGPSIPRYMPACAQCLIET